MNKLLVLAYLCVQFVTLAFANEPGMDSLELTRFDERIIRLQNTLQANERNADGWWKTWTILYGAATVGQGAVAIATTDKSTREDMLLGAGTTILGVASQILTPVCTHFKPIEKDSIAKLSLANKQRLLEKDEKILEKQADIAIAGKSWQVHALFGVGNLASGLITWIGFKRSFGEGVFNFALNMVITETQIWTQPVRAKKAFKRYIQEDSRGFGYSSTLTPEWYGQVSPASCSFGLRF